MREPDADPLHPRKSQVFGMPVHVADEHLKDGPAQQREALFHRGGGVLREQSKEPRQARTVADIAHVPATAERA